MPLKILLLLLLLALSTSPASAQKVCSACKDQGFVACTSKEHDQKRHCGISIEHKCDTIYLAECCSGIGRLPCKRCKDPVIEGEIESEIERRRAWVESAREVDRKTGITMVHVETDHFIVHFAIPDWKTKAANLTRTKAAHLFAERLEEVARRFEEITGELPFSKQTFYMVKNATENKLVTLHEMGGGHESTFKLYSMQCKVCQWPNPVANLTNDDAFHAHIVHNATHTLTQASIMFHRQIPAWFDTGLAHWLEMEMFGYVRNYCFQEVQAKGPWELGDWRKKLFSEVAGQDELSFAAVSALELDRMDHRAHAHAWSFIDYLIRTDPERFKSFFRAVKSRNDTKAALDEVYGISTASLHDQWRAWVAKSYGGR